MLTDPKDNNVAGNYIETLPCQWSLLVINIGGKQASLHPTDHLFRNGLHAEFLDADNGAHWAKALQFNSGGFRPALADLIEEEYQESFRGLSPLWLPPDSRNVFNTAKPEEAEVAYSSWLKQGSSKGLLDAEDADEDDDSDEPSHSDDQDEFNAGGPPSDTESAKA